MNVVYISPHFPENYIQFCQSLRKFSGVNVLGIGDNDYDCLPQNLRESLTEYYKIDNMNDYNQLVRALGFFTYKYGKIDFLESNNEHWLFSDAKLRTDFNIPGIKADVITDMKYKSKMKQRFRNAGVEVPRGEIIHDIDIAKKFIREVGYPVVAKPDNGVGASATFKIRNEQELKLFFENKPDTEYIFEEFINGIIVTFDGLVDYDGNLQFYTSHVFRNGVMDIVNKQLDMFYFSLREISKDLEKAGRAVLKEFDIRARFFHFEFFRRKTDNRIVALEVNMRPPGGFTTDMMNFANDFDIYYQWANIVVNNKFDAKWNRRYHTLYIGRKNNQKYKHQHDEIISELGGLLVHHKPMADIFSSVLGNYGYIVRSESLDEIKDIITYALS